MTPCSYEAFAGDAAAWEALIQDSPDLNLLQTWAFGAAKECEGPWRAERGLLVSADRTVGAVQAMIRKAPGGRSAIAWINRGPLRLREDAELLPMLQALGRHFIVERGYYLRILPMTCDPGFDGRGAGLRETSTPGWASAVVDLTQDEADLRKGLHGKWRNALVGAERADLRVQAGDDDETVSTFMRGHKAHLEKLGPAAGIDTGFLSALRDRLPAERRLSCVLAWRDDQPLGGVAIARYGRTGEYLAGHNTDAGRAQNAGQLLLWTAMRDLMSEGYERFDLGGMDERLTPPGIYRFKQRVGGTPYRLVNEWDGGTGGLINKLIRWRVERDRKRQSMGSAA